MSDQGTVVESTMTPGNPENFSFCGSMNARLDESGKMMTTLVWTSSVCLDSHELVAVIPEPDKKSRFVEGIFNFHGSLLSVYISPQYAEQRKAGQVATEVPTPPPSPIEATNPVNWQLGYPCRS